MNPQLLERILEFRDQRQWDQFHTARTLAVSVLVEAAELVETFQWVHDADLDDLVNTKRQQIAEEIADISIYTSLLAEKLGIDIDSAILQKIELNEQKYPVEKSKGKSDKYTEL